ncbi:MAG: hypothetical protein C0402_06950 [Thermodesulfovibrio sp.]|nr:hypothetical protein [Thermodesulfovibrio sp.]
MKKILGTVVSLFVAVLFVGVAFAVNMSTLKNYSADMETTTKQGTFTSKIFYKDTKTRMESKGSIIIMRTDKKVMWMVQPEQKSYMEMALDINKQDIQSKLQDPNIKVDKEFVANDVVDKHPAKKYHMTITTNGKKEQSGFIWEATDLSNFPVKYESEDKKTSTVWKNIKTNSVSDSAFEVPADYKKMTMPSMPEGMGGGSSRKRK